jgi:hypothetical protein
MTRGTTWEGVEYLVVTKVKNKHSLTAIVPTVGPWSLQNPKYTFVSGIKLNMQEKHVYMTLQQLVLTIDAI